MEWFLYDIDLLHERVSEKVNSEKLLVVPRFENQM